MAPIWIFSRDERPLTSIRYKGDPSDVLLSAIHKEQINGVNTFEFEVIANSDKAEYLQEENIVLIKDEYGDWLEFVITRITENHTGGQLTKLAFCEHASRELLDYAIRDIRPENRDAAYMINQILQDTRWSVGTVEVEGTNTHIFYNKSVLQCLYEVQELFGGEFKFRTEFTGNKITNRYVDLLIRRGEDRGKRYVHGKDVTDIKREVDTENLATALIGRGKGVETEEGGYGRKLDFTEVYWSVDDGDPADKPYGQDWVGDEEALIQFGRPDGQGGLKHRTRIIEFPDEEDPNALLEKTWEALQIMKEPAVTYDLTVIDLSQAEGHEHEFVSLGDTVAVIDKQFNPEIRFKTRVVEIERDFINPDNTRIVLGNMYSYSSDIQRSLDLQDRVLDKPVETSWLSGYIDTLKNEVVGGAGTVRHTGDGLLVLDRPADQDPQKAILLNNGVLALSNQRVPGGDPATAGGWVFGTFIDGDGAYADKIVAGTMLADRVRGGELYLGGVVNNIGKDGKLYLVDKDDEIVCQMDAENAGFNRLWVGTISGNNVVTKNFSNTTYYVNPTTGSDNNDGSSSSPFKSLQAAIQRIPEINEAEITINVAPNSELTEVVEIIGKSGSGIIRINFNNSVLNGYVRIGSCLQRIYLENGIISHTGEQHHEDSSPYACVRTLVSNWIVVDKMVLLANGKAKYCASCEGANMVIRDSRVFGASDSLIFATVGSQIKVVNTSGNGPVALKAMDTGWIAGYGYRPNGTTSGISMIAGGQVTGTWTSVNNGGAPPTVATPNKGVWHSTAGRSWDTVFGWSNAPVPRQGNPGSWGPSGTHKGLWFFDSASIRSSLAGKTPKSIRILLKRQSKGGYAASRPLFFWTHNNTSATGGEPVLSNSAGNLANFAWGEQKWVTLPLSYATALRDNTAKGIAIYTPNTSQTYYISMEIAATLEITW